ncbi:MAG: hypothetical protein ACI9UK_001358 [Candidatus Krumholzibacteriia bacterium]|jgi:hypothetical protein
MIRIHHDIPKNDQVTMFLEAYRQGDADAFDRVVPMLYEGLDAKDRGHFLAISARAMRQVLAKLKASVSHLAYLDPTPL